MKRKFDFESLFTFYFLSYLAVGNHQRFGNTALAGPVAGVHRQSGAVPSRHAQHCGLAHPRGPLQPRPAVRPAAASGQHHPARPHHRHLVGRYSNNVSIPPGVRQNYETAWGYAVCQTPGEFFQFPIFFLPAKGKSENILLCRETSSLDEPTARTLTQFIVQYANAWT